MTARNPAARAAVARLSAPVLHPTRDSVRRLALAAVIANAVLICTGAAGRLSSSGLEFGNRLLTFPLAAIAGLVFIACLCYKPEGRRRGDLVRLSAVLPVGVIAQAVAGGIVVLTRLNPALVAAHFLLSAAILAFAVVLQARAGEGPGSVRPLVRADLRILAGLLVAATALMLALQDVTRLHADIGWFIGALAVALMIGTRFSGAPARTVRASRIVLVALAAQGAIGYAQYSGHLPAGLAWVHVAMATVLWILVLRLYLSTRERRPGLAEALAQAYAASVARNQQALEAEGECVGNGEAGTRRGRAAAPAAQGIGPGRLAVVYRSQGDRAHVPDHVVLLLRLRRDHGTADACPARRPGRALRVRPAVQRAVHDARRDHAAAVRDSHVRRFRE